MRYIFLPILFFYFHPAFAQEYISTITNLTVATGGMPDMKKDKANTLHLVYGNGDSILYIHSDDGRSFSRPETVGVLPGLFSFAMRGPQVAVPDKRVVVTAATKRGDIYVFTKAGNGKWADPILVNDVKGSAPEALMAVDADGSNVFAVWLDIRNNKKGQSIFGARSADGGKTWSKNHLVYSSPDRTVCECCKPSVVVKGNYVHVMFRNLADGNRDLYLLSSANQGKTFGQAKKLGNGSWKLDGCPMDGGAMTVNKKGSIQTVWRREGKIYAAEPGKAETEIGTGKICTMTSVGNKNIYAWVENGEVVIVLPGRDKLHVGKGSMPDLESVGSNAVACTWEYEKQVHFVLISL